MFKKLLKRISSTLNCKAGELYTIPVEGQYGVFKVLKVDTKGLHVRVYSNLYTQVPSKIDEKELYIDLKSSSGAEHTPLTYASIKLWQPSFLQDSKVKTEELDAYFYWKTHNHYYI